MLSRCCSTRLRTKLCCRAGRRQFDWHASMSGCSPRIRPPVDVAVCTAIGSLIPLGVLAATGSTPTTPRTGGATSVVSSESMLPKSTWQYWNSVQQTGSTLVVFALRVHRYPSVVPQSRPPIRVASPHWAASTPSFTSLRVEEYSLLLRSTILRRTTFDALSVERAQLSNLCCVGTIALCSWCLEQHR